MTIVGTDGKAKYITEGEKVTDAAVACVTFTLKGYHVLDWDRDYIIRRCVRCNQTEEELNLKGEPVVY
jgi:hypothetical protein